MTRMTLVSDGCPARLRSWRAEKVDDDHPAAHDSDADGASTDAD